MHRITSYTKKALWDAVKAWFEGGPPASGAIDPQAAFVHRFTGKGGATWEIYPDGTAKEDKVPLAWNAFATPTVLDAHTFGYRWNYQAVAKTDSKDGPLATLPEYFRLAKDEAGKKPQWVPVRSEDVPAETGLKQVRFDRSRAEHPEPYVTPDDAASCWKKPGPAAGPFQAQLGDGSVVTYYWYRFADQPALLNADLTAGRTRGDAGAGGEAAPELEDGPRLPAATHGRKAGGNRPCARRHSAAGLGGGICPHRHATSGERIARDDRTMTWNAPT